VVPSSSTRRPLSLWYGQGCCGYLYGPLCTQLCRLCLRASLAHPPSPSTLLPTHPLVCDIHDISGSVQNISQNQSVHPVAIQVSVMIAIALLHSCCKSYVATIKQRESITHFIFQICISRNQVMCICGGFSKIGSHIYIYIYIYIYIHSMYTVYVKSFEGKTFTVFADLC